jgi:hypothetical protein
LFGILDTLLTGSQGLMEAARARLSADKGATALSPWNTGFMMAGDVEKQLDPYVGYPRFIVGVLFFCSKCDEGWDHFHVHTSITPHLGKQAPLHRRY